MKKYFWTLFSFFCVIYLCFHFLILLSWCSKNHFEFSLNFEWLRIKNKILPGIVLEAVQLLPGVYEVLLQVLDLIYQVHVLLFYPLQLSRNTVSYKKNKNKNRNRNSNTKINQKSRSQSQTNVIIAIAISIPISIPIPLWLWIWLWLWENQRILNFKAFPN